MADEKTYWRSLQDASQPEADPAQLVEFPAPAAPGTDGDSGLDRRQFLTVMSASMALAGTGALAGCVRKPKEHILPFANRPEGVDPGKPLHYATAAVFGGSVQGLLVTSTDGRPTKIEGNPLHPMNPVSHLGAARDQRFLRDPEREQAILRDQLHRAPQDATRLWYAPTSTWAQASVLDLYDADRSTKPRLWKASKKGGKRTQQTASWAELWKAFDAAVDAVAAGQGAKLGILVDDLNSPTLLKLLDSARQGRFRLAQFYASETALRHNEAAGLALAGAADHHPVYHLHRANVILSIDSDFLQTEGDVVRNSRFFAEGRLTRRRQMNRLYCVEGRFSVTGLNADNRLRVASREVGQFLKAVAAELEGSLKLPLGLGLSPAEVTGFANRAAKSAGKSAIKLATWVKEVARDLQAARGRAVVMVGERQPPWVHGLAHAINSALGSVDATRGPLHYVKRPLPAKFGSVAQMAQDLKGGKISSLMVLGGNPAYSAPADLGLGKLLKRVTTIHLGYFVDETARAASIHIPQSHFLESWGDLQSSDGTISIQQPLIAPLFGEDSKTKNPARTLSASETLARALGFLPHGHTLVRNQWKAAVPTGFETTWQRWLHDGVTTIKKAPPAAPNVQPATLKAALAKSAPVAASGLEANFILDPSLYDGRYANNAWLQELPDTITKLTWDNAVQLGVNTASRLGVETEDLVTVSLGRRRLKMVAFVTPGLAEDTLVLPLGYGSKIGGVARHGKGFDSNRLRSASAPHFAQGAKVSKADDTYELATTQHHGSMVEPHTGKKRPFVREATLKEFRDLKNYDKHRKFSKKWKQWELMPKHMVRSLWTPPNVRTGYQWGMSIDLNRCTGCNACTVACQAENNIPTVGKKQCLNGREMHWIRIDRYFTSPAKGDPEKYADAHAVVEPVPCMHCENAPCENVCPVGATLHSPEGLNEMAYNRCIGTRYCLNNCPYKVRRFNFFNFTKEQTERQPLIVMQRNPEVTVRFRGVVEKCTYCVQRIVNARIEAKVDRKLQGVIEDGAVVTACQQACPTGAIVFGDQNNHNLRTRKRSRPTRVSVLKRDARNYELLRDFNHYARTTYLVKLRNPNEKLA